MSELIGVWVNCASEEEATRIAEEAVKRRLAACSNIRAPIVSSYHWKGRVENNREVPLLLKTRPSLFGHLSRFGRSALERRPSEFEIFARPNCAVMRSKGQPSIRPYFARQVPFETSSDMRERASFSVE